MRAVGNLLAFLVALVAALAAALFGMGLVAGPDIGFAGAGLWFVMLPVAFVGLLGGLLCTRLKAWSGDPFLRRAAFVVGSAVISYALAAGGTKVLLSAWASGTPEFAYIPSSSYTATIEVTAPAEVVAGEPFRVQARYKGGPWERVRYKDLKEERYANVAPLNRTERPPEMLTCNGAAMFWETEPQDPAGGLLMGERTGSDCIFTLRTPGTYKLWAWVNSPVDAKSNEVSVKVHAK